jgi:pyruvate dehydrogenase E2 component (dihydrolipoamide acetyltransferase)
MVCWCVIRALEKFPDANSHFLTDRIRNFHQVHLGIAVDTPRGLMVPVLRNADRLDLPGLSKGLKDIAEAGRKGSIDPELIQSTSATFTVSNLGNYGVEMFTPVINLPQVAILGVCTIINRPADIGNNIFGFVPYIGLSLTYDHRAIDGGPATLFLKEIKDQIESFRYKVTT